jgi:hypothetical protein
MKTIKIKLLFLMSLLFVLNCGNDDDNSNPPEDNTSELIDALIADITNSSETIWKIESATLTNNSVTNLDVSDTFNIADDEFVFKTVANSQTIALEHKQGNAFNENATDANDFLIDFYKSADNFSLEVTSLENKVFANNNKAFTYNSTGSIDAEFILSNGTLNLNLSPKTSADYATPPTAGLNFTESFVYTSSSVDTHAPGMIGSYSDNSFFIVGREDALNTGSGAPERIVKFNLTNGTTQEKLFFQTDFVSKQLHIQNNQLIALGGQFVNTYSLDVNSDPNTVNHGKSFSRHGVAVQDNDMYVIGGDLNNTESNKIFKWSLTNESLTEVATMPEPRSGARGTIVNNKLYIFGGTEEFTGNPAKNTIYVYDLVNGGFDTLTMPEGLNFTHVDRFQNLIYVAGRIDADDDSGRDLYIGVLNTEDNSFQEITSNLDDSDQWSTIHTMCVFNGKMYVLYGGVGVDNGGTLLEWSVMAADL